MDYIGGIDELNPVEILRSTVPFGANVRLRDWQAQEFLENVEATRLLCDELGIDGLDFKVEGSTLILNGMEFTTVHNMIETLQLKQEALMTETAAA